MLQIIVLAAVWRNHPTNEFGKYKHLVTTHICMTDNLFPMYNLYTYQDF